MISPEITEFIANYTTKRRSQIAFAWDGKYGDNFNDPNIDFRIKVIDAVVENPELAPLDLVKDLYIAEIACARETKGIYLKVRFLAGILLNRGGSAYLKVFLEGRIGTMDTFCETAQVKLSQEVATQLAKECQKSAYSAENDYDRHFYQKGREFFEWKAEVAE